MPEVARFRIKPDCVGAALRDFRSVGVQPAVITPRDDGAVSIEFHDLSYLDASAIAGVFRTEHSAIIGVIGGSPFEDK